MTSKPTVPEAKPAKAIVAKKAGGHETARLFLDVEAVNRRSQRIVPKARYVE